MNSPKAKSGVISPKEEAEITFILKYYTFCILIINEVIVDNKGENNLFNNTNKDGSFNVITSLAEDN